MGNDTVHNETHGIVGTTVSLQEMVERVLDQCDVKETTRQSYRYGLRDFLRWNTSGVLGLGTLVEYKNHLRDRKDLSTSTKNQYISGVRMVIRRLHQLGILERDYGLGVKGFKVGKSLKRNPITDEEVTKVFNLVREMKDKRLLVIYTLLYLQGLRQSEVLSITVEDFDSQGGTLRLLGKTRDDYELIDLHPDAVTVLNWYLKETGLKSGYLFWSKRSPSGHMTRQHLHSMIRGVHQRCGITNVGHGWRKVFVSKLIESGLELLTVQQFSRHQSLGMLSVYYDRLDKKKKLPQYYNVFSNVVSLDTPESTINKEVVMT